MCCDPEKAVPIRLLQRLFSRPAGAKNHLSIHRPAFWEEFPAYGKRRLFSGKPYSGYVLVLA
jgi:hypothetical protein